MAFNDVEKAREAYHQKTKTGWIIISCAVALAILISFIIGIPFLIAFFAFFVFIVGTIILSFASKKEAKNYRQAYKAYFVAANLQKVFQNLTYDHQKGISKSFINSTGMINTGDRFSSNDLTFATYKNTKFAQADATIQVEHTDSDGNTTYETIFKGRFMVFEFPKKFNFKLELIGKHFHAYKIPGKDPKTGRKMQKVQTESVDFNRKFKIFGADGFETYYILDPAIMVRIEQISDRFKNKILLGFTDNSLLVALNDGTDSFEPPRAGRPIDEAAEHQKILNDIRIITDFVDIISH